VDLVKGHLDLSAVMIGRHTAEAPSQTLTERFQFENLFSFMAPFTVGLWSCLMVLVILSGVTDYIVEHSRGATHLRASMYEYSAGFLWGGFEYPQTRIAAIYQVFLGFFALVMVSSYTANLASFIVLSAQPTLSVVSIEEAILNRKALCHVRGAAYIPRVRRSYPRARFFGEMDVTPTAMAQRLADGDGCEGMVATMNDFHQFRRNPEFCQLQVVQTIWMSLGGWASNSRSWCVRDAISQGLQGLEDVGDIDRLFEMFYPQAACVAETATAETRRRLLESHHGDYGDDAVGPSRRLTSSKSGISAAAMAAVGSAANLEVEHQMQILDFTGLWIVWLGLTVVAVLIRYFPSRWHQRIVDYLPTCFTWLMGFKKTSERQSPAQDPHAQRPKERPVADELSQPDFALSTGMGVLQALLHQVEEMREEARAAAVGREEARMEVASLRAEMRSAGRLPVRTRLATARQPSQKAAGGPEEGSAPPPKDRRISAKDEMDTLARSAPPVQARVVRVDHVLDGQLEERRGGRQSRRRPRAGDRGHLQEVPVGRDDDKGDRVDRRASGALEEETPVMLRAEWM